MSSIASTPATNASLETIPIVDVGAFLRAEPGAASQLAARVAEAFEKVGFLVMTGHDIDQSRIDAIFEQAARFHAQPLAAKQALAMNEHNNGYMAKARYAVWTSDVNDNDQPDLNEAFFIKRERVEGDPQLGPNLGGERQLVARNRRGLFVGLAAPVLGHV